MKMPIMWQNIATAPEGVSVWTRKGVDEYGDVQVVVLVFQSGLWFFPDMSAYVYYVPSHWAPVDD